MFYNRADKVYSYIAATYLRNIKKKGEEREPENFNIFALVYESNIVDLVSPLAL